MSTVGDVLLIAGAAWTLLSAVGVNRFDDVFARMHAATKSTTLGLLLVFAGAAFHLPAGGAAKLVLAGLLLVVTAPLGAHLVGRSVHERPGTASVRIDALDELGRRDTAEGDDD